MSEEKKLLKRKLHVNIGSMNLWRGQPLSKIREFLDEQEALAKSKNYTDIIINAHQNDYRDQGNEDTYLDIYAKREETEEEYQERLKRIEINKVQKREYDLKQFYELKERLGL
jgi:hypothetical protein